MQFSEHPFGPVTPYGDLRDCANLQWRGSPWIILDEWGTSFFSNLVGDVMPGCYGIDAPGVDFRLALHEDRLEVDEIHVRTWPIALPRICGISPLDEAGNPLPTAPEGPVHWAHRTRALMNTFYPRREPSREPPSQQTARYPGVRLPTGFSGWLRLISRGYATPPPQALVDVASSLPVERWAVSEIWDLGFQNGRVVQRLLLTGEVRAWEAAQWQRMERLFTERGIYEALNAAPECFPLLHECREPLWA